MTTAVLAPRATLVQHTGLTSTRARAALLVLGGALLTAAAAQVTIPLPFTPVPITGQTFAVLLTGATFGSRLGASSQALYVALGAIGLPFYADGAGGWEAASGATGGYLVGFVVAAALLGALAERQQDRTVLTAVPAMLAGTATIYLFGATWLSVHLGMPAATAVELGVAPFLIGDACKLAAAGVLLPATWRMVDRHR